MVSSFTLKTDELDNNFLATIKKLFAGKEIEIKNCQTINELE